MILLYPVNIIFQLGIQALSRGELLLAIGGRTNTRELREGEFAVCALLDVPLPAVLLCGIWQYRQGDCVCVYAEPVLNEPSISWASLEGCVSGLEF